MQVVCLDDAHFPALLEAWRSGKALGTFIQHGKAHLVKASARFLFVSPDEGEKTLMFEPARSLSEAELLAKRLFESLDTFRAKEHFDQQQS